METGQMRSLEDQYNGIDPDPSSAQRPAKKQRKQRPSYSCRECRRLKMKCDRQEPCSNCIRRDKVQLCIDQSTTDLQHRRAETIREEYDQQHPQQRTSQPPMPLQPSVAEANTISPPIRLFGHHQFLGQQQPLPQQAVEQPHHEQPPLPLPHNDAGHHGQFNKLEHVAKFARAIEPLAASRSHSQSPGRVACIQMPNESNPILAASVAEGGHHHGSSISEPVVENAEQSGSHGTLMFTKGGTSKYLGPTAGSEWLKDSEMREVSVTPTATRAQTPEVASPSKQSRQNDCQDPATAQIAFPFTTSKAYIRTQDLLARLPPREEAWTLVESYYRYCAWHHDVAPQSSIIKTFDRVYQLVDGLNPSSPVNAQEIALIFMIMCQGTLYNIEMAHNDASAEEWLRLAQQALVKGEFMAINTIPGVQTLNLMAHHHLELDKGRRGDYAWPLWGLVMRLIQAMGMHRDGTRWSLPEDVVEERRKVFWECNAADIFQAHCFSRPCAINPEHCDTMFPTEPLNLKREKSYSRLRYELSQISSEILNMAMKVRKPEYAAVTQMDVKLCNFEQNVSFSLRCRAAFLAMPSRYPKLEAAIEASPEPSRSLMQASFQQMNLELNISETIINLHRPYYAKALYEDVDDPVKSVYAPSYLTVIERCSIIIAIVADIHSRFPAVSTRQWNLWYHVFGSALCLGTLALRNPVNPLASLILGRIDASIQLFTSLIRHGANTPRYHRNLEWLLRLRARASAKISTPSTTRTDGLQHDMNVVTNHQEGHAEGTNEGDDGEEVELIGWRTRLIQRAGQDRRTIRTMGLVTTPNSASDTTDMPEQPPNQNFTGGFLSQMKMADTALPLANLDSIFTDDFLHDFWDPLLPDDIFKDLSADPNLFGSQG